MPFAQLRSVSIEQQVVFFNIHSYKRTSYSKSDAGFFPCINQTDIRMQVLNRLDAS